MQAWAEQVLAEMNQDEPVRNVAGAKDKQQRHIELKAEIDARADTFASLAESGQAMIKNGHFAAGDVGILFSFRQVWFVCAALVLLHLFADPVMDIIILHYAVL